MKWFDAWRQKTEDAHQEQPKSPCVVHSLKVVNACDILKAIPTENPAHQYLEDLVDMYLDWSQTGSLQKLAGVDVILVKADTVLDRIKFRVETERGKEKRGTHVLDTLTPFLSEVDYLNIYRRD